MSAAKAERYAAYYGIGEGLLRLPPEHWRMCRLKDQACFNPSKSEVKAIPEECTFAPMEKLKTDSLLTDTTILTSDVSGSYTYFREDDILVAKVTPCFENRNIAIAKNLTNGIGFGSSEINVIRISPKAHRRWFFYLFLTSAFIETGASKMAGAGGLKRIPSVFLETFTFSLPPVAQQVSIAAYLDTKTAQIDRQIDLLGQKATQYGKLKQSIINETVTRGLDKSVPMQDSGVEWIGAVPEHWKIRRINDIAIQNKIKNSNLTETNLLSLSYGRIIRKDFNTSFGLLPESFETYQVVNEGTVILRLTDLQNDQRSLRVGLASERGIITSAYLGLIFNRSINSNFAYYLLHVYDLAKVFYWFGGGLRSTMRFDDIKVIPFVIPPLDEQKVIAKYLDEKTAHIDRIVTAINTQIDKLKDLRKALINDVMIGRIKVVSEGAAI